jgi:hypothetical protein
MLARLKIGDRVRFITPYNFTDNPQDVHTITAIINDTYVCGSGFNGNRHMSRFILVSEELKGLAAQVKLQEELSKC